MTKRTLSKNKLVILLFCVSLISFSIAIHAAHANRVIVVEYFYFPPCDCGKEHLNEMTEVNQLVSKIQSEYRDQVRIESIDVSIPEGSNLLNQYNITEAPAILINHEYRISGVEITWEKLKFVIDGYITESPLTPENNDPLIITVPLIIVSGLVDGVNPCAFALMNFFFSFLYTIHKTRRSVFKIGVAYISSLFVTNFAAGLGLLRAVTFFGIEHMFSQIGIILIIILGLIAIKNSLMPGGFSLKFIERAFPKARSLIERATLPAALALGGLVGLCAFSCSGGIYIGVLALLAAQSTYIEGLASLVLYNLMFILPLLFVFLFASNRRTLAKINRWNIRKSRRNKLISGVFMLVLGLLTWLWTTI